MQASFHATVALGIITVFLVLAPSQAQSPGGGTTPVAVRNARALPGEEVLVLRHQELKKGAHEEYYRASLAGVWPWYEQIGTRIVGQWLVVERDGVSVAGLPVDDAYRLARYASFDHWRATRDGANAQLGGDGPSRDRSLEAGRDRVGVQTASKGAYFLQGENAPTRPLHMPGLGERYERVDGTPSTDDEIVAVRTEAARPGREVVELRYQRIRKGAFPQFVARTRDAIWPWEEKLGARPLGQWTVIYPAAPSRTQESPDSDEVITMTRYASRAHWQAMAPRRAVLLRR
jgi:hypothetical protein